METCKKFSKKFFLLLSLLTIAILSFVIPKTLNASTVTISRVVKLDYIEDRHGSSLGTWKKVLSTGETGYCMEYGKTAPNGESFTLKGNGDQGLVYIMKSEPNMGSENEDWYVRQVAIYRYLGDAEWIQYATKGLKYVDAAQRLANEAKSAAKTAKAPKAGVSISPSTAQFRLEGDKYVAGPFTINKTGTMTSINLQLSGVPGIVLKNSSGQVVNNLAVADTSFTVEVAKAGLPSGNHTLNIALEGTFKGEGSSKIWQTTSSSIQDIGSLVEVGGDDVEANTNANATLTKAPDNGTGRFRKVDADTKQPIAGVSFEIRQNGNVIGNGTTNAQGILDMALAPGNYQVIETATVPGFILDSTPKDVTIRENEVSDVEITNVPVKATFRVLKIDEETKKTLVGATFVLYKDGVEVDRQVTDNRGIATFSNVRYGTYEIREVLAPEGYVINSQPINVEVGPDSNGQVIPVELPNKMITGTVEVLKKDKELKDLVIEGAKFGLYRDDKLMYEATSNANGIAKFENVKFGPYKLKEISPAEGYLPTTQEWDVNITEDGKTYNYEVENEVIKGKIQIVKIDGKDEEKPVEGAVFELYKASDIGNALATLTTDKDGFAYTEDLRYGDYVLKEVDAPGDYYINGKLYPVSIKEHGKVVVQYIVNMPVEFRLKVVKIDGETKKPLAGAHFQIHQDGKPIEFTYQAGSQIVKETTFVSDDKGLILLPTALRAGTYQLVEVKTPVGYNPIDPIEFVVDRDTELGADELGPILEVVVENHIIKGNVKLLKVENKDKKPLEGVKFELYKTNTIPEDTSGLATDGEQPEAEEPKDENPITRIIKGIKGIFSKEGNDTPVTDENGENKEPVTKPEGEETPKPEGEEEAVKPEKDEVPAPAPSENLMQGDGKTLDNGDKQIGLYATNSDGLIYVEDLAYGDYYFKEVETLEGYVLSEEPVKFQITEHGKTIELTKENRLIKGKVEIDKTDVSTGELLPNTGITIWDETQTVEIATGRTDENGHLSFELEYGKYFFQEYDAPEGYVIDESLFPFEIKEDGEIIKCQMTNKKIEGELEITKVDVSDGKLLPDTTFAIYGEDGKEVIVKGKTDENGIAKFKLEYGKYFYQEIEAPAGYMIDQTKFPFEIKEDGEIIKCRMTNTKLPKTGAVPPAMLAGGVAALGGLGALGGATVLRKRKK